MDDLQLLSTTRDTVGTIPEATLARGRERLMRAAHDQAAALENQRQNQNQNQNLHLNRVQNQVQVTAAHVVPRKTRSTKARPVRFRRGLALAGAAALFLTGVGVSADVLVPEWRSLILSPERKPLNAEAVAVLEDAAAATMRTSDLVVLPGQYLKVEKKALGGASSIDTGVQLSWNVTTSDQLYLPADLEGEWVWNRDPAVPTESAPDVVKEAARLLPTVDPKSYAALTGVVRGPGGVFFEGEQYTIVGAPLSDTSEIPRDPDELLNRIYDHTKGAGKDPGLEAFETIVEYLRTGIIPADLRAALYQAAALIPGVEITDERATIDGRSGTAIGKATPDGGSRQDMIIDTETGLVIGERFLTLKDFPGAPAGTITEWTSATTSVVDSAP